MTQTTFIAFLRYEKMSNQTLDFKKIFNEIEGLSFSNALIVLNKNEIVKKLLSMMT